MSTRAPMRHYLGFEAEMNATDLRDARCMAKLVGLGARCQLAKEPRHNVHEAYLPVASGAVEAVHLRWCNEANEGKRFA